MNRRAFLLSGFAVAIDVAVGKTARATQPVTLTEWLSASRKKRKAALQSCLNRVRSMDSSIHAWVQVQPEQPIGHGKLGDIPFGAKDIMETKGLSTEYGSPIYKGRIGTADAAIVHDLRQRGAILLGKTQCTAFAYRTPPPTRNPHDLEHTPGGSSSGSAAAVAAGMVPFALGTQTRGSVLRPASFCGVTGFKPTYGLFSLEGVLPLAKSLDTLGFFTHAPDDMLVLWESLGHSAGPKEDFALGAPQPMLEVEPAMAAAFQNTLAMLQKSGISVRPVAISEMLDKLNETASTVEAYEGARFHEQRYKEYGARLAELAGLIQKGLQISLQRYDEARRYITECKDRMAEMYEATPVILVPAATGPAPVGLTSTGDPRMNAPWTALGTPAISIPMQVRSSLPLGLQLTAAPGQDARLLRTAVRVAGLLS